MNILVVDDSKASRMILKRALRQAGFGVHPVQEAGDGAEALRVIDEGNPGLVLCDWNMPRMNGMELLQQLKIRGLRVTLGFVTSEGTDDVRARAREAGAAFFVSKPITSEKLEEALRPFLGAS